MIWNDDNQHQKVSLWTQLKTLFVSNMEMILQTAQFNVCYTSRRLFFFFWQRVLHTSVSRSDSANRDSWAPHIDTTSRLCSLYSVNRDTEEEKAQKQKYDLVVVYYV